MKKSNVRTGPFEANTQSKWDVSFGGMTTTRIRQGLFPNGKTRSNTEAPILLTNFRIEKTIKVFMKL